MPPTQASTELAAQGSNRPQPTWGVALGVALIAVVAALAARIVLQPIFAEKLPFFTFFPALFAVAWWGGFRPTLLTTLFSVPALMYFVMPRTFSWQVEFAEHRVGLPFFVAIGLALGWMGEKLKTARWDQQRALEHATREQERLRVTLASIGDAVIVADHTGRVTSLNPVAESLTGWLGYDARGRTLDDVFHIVNEETRQPVENPCAKVLSTGAIVGLANHTVLISRDGTERPIDDSAAPIMDTAGKVCGVIIVFRDVSDKRVAERDLRRNEQELADFFDNAALPMHAAGPDGTILRANQAELDMLGYSRDEYVGHNVTEFHVDKRAIESLLARLARGEVMHNYEARLLCKDGSIKDVLVTSSVLWEGDTFIQTRCFTRDITHRKHAEESLVFLARAGSALSALVDRESALQQAARLPVPFLADWCVVYIVDDRGGIDYQAHAHRDPSQERILSEMLTEYPLNWNSVTTSVEALRTGKPQLMEHVSDELLDGIAQNDHHRQLIERLHPHAVISVPLRVRERILGVIGLVATDPNRRYSRREVGLAESFAERVATAVENARLYHAVTEANRQKDEFLAMLAHELRNPLAAIRYAVTLGQLPNAGPTDELFNIVDRQTQNLARLIDDLLDVSRISRDKVTLQMEHVDAADIVREAAETVRPLIEQRQHELVFEFANQPTPLLVDRTRAEQIVANLLTNAAKYTPEQGRIHVRVHVENSDVVISVSDNGIGLSPDMCYQVFDLFTQANRALDRSEGGLGIGLTVARRLAELHGGSVSAESAGLGQGSTFTVCLPLCLDSTGVGPMQPVTPLADAVTLRILVVDDNHDTATSAAMLLRAFGHEVQTAFDGPAAIELARSFQPQAFLLDIGLPGMNGYEVAQALRRDGFAQATIVAVSGYGQADDRRRSAEAGFDHHFVKPVDYTALLDVLQIAATTPQHAR